MRCELFNYIEALCRSPRLKSMNFVTYIGGIFAAVVSIYFGLVAMNFWSVAAGFLAGFVLMVASILGMTGFNSKPNIVSQMPLSPRKSLLYRFVSVLILFVLICLFMLLVMLVVSFITTGFILLFDAIAGIEGGTGDISEEIEIISPMGVHGGIFAGAFFVFMYSMGMIIGFIRTRKIQNIVTWVLGAVLLGGMILMRNPYLQESYDKMSVPWLCTALCCVAAVAALGTAIYMGVKQYRKSY